MQEPSGRRLEEACGILQQRGGWSRRRLAISVGVTALFCAVALGGWAATLVVGGGGIVLEGIDSKAYEDKHKLMYRNIKDLYSWKLDWALGAGPLGASGAGFDEYMKRLGKFASDAGKVAAHMQVCVPMFCLFTA